MNSQQPSWGARGVLATIARGWLMVVGVAVLYGLVALGYNWLSTPLYQASSTVYVTSGSGSAAGGSSFDAVRASQERAATYAKLMYSDAVISPALASARLGMSVGDAKSNLQVEVDPAVMTMTISATDPDPLVAQRLANAISDSLADAVSTLDVPSGGGSPAARLTVVNTATVDPDPVWPKTYLNIGIAAGVGLLVGLCLTLLLEQTNNKVRDGDDAEVAFDARVLATLKGSGDSDSVLDFDADRGEAAAAFRTLRTGFAAATQESPVEVLAVTSPRGGDATAAVTLNLAGALAQADNSVVVLDANFEGSRISRRFNAEGITDVLSGRVSLDSVVKPADGADFAVVGVGTQRHGNSTDMLSSKAFSQLLAELAHRFDYVLIDTPSLLDELDAAACVAWAGGVLVVVPRKTRLSDLRKVRTRLVELNVRVIGLVLVEQSGNKQAPSARRHQARDTQAQIEEPTRDETATRGHGRPPSLTA